MMNSRIFDRLQKRMWWIFVAVACVLCGCSSLVESQENHMFGIWKREDHLTSAYGYQSTYITLELKNDGTIIRTAVSSQGVFGGHLSIPMTSRFTVRGQWGIDWLGRFWWRFPSSENAKTVSQEKAFFRRQWHGPHAIELIPTGAERGEAYFRTCQRPCEARARQTRDTEAHDRDESH